MNAGESTMGLEHFENFAGMFGWLHLWPDFLYLSIRPNQERDAVRARVFNSHESIWAISAIRVDDLFVFIDQQRERQIMLLDKFRVRLRRIGAHAKNHSSFLFEFSEIIPKRTGFFRATRRRILGIKIENHVLASKIQ